MANSLLIIDDDERLTELLRGYLVQAGFEVFSAGTPDQGLKLFDEKKPSLVILDVMLPDRDGFQVCKELRAKASTPILMLTARGEIGDRVKGLDTGADDYLPKPFEPRELVARIQSILRRAGVSGENHETLVAGELRLSMKSRQAWLGKEDLQITSTEFELLRLFMLNAGKVLSRDDIMDRLRGIDWEAFNRSIDVAVSRLRQKLKDNSKQPKYFKTVWGTGYLFLPDVKQEG